MEMPFVQSFSSLAISYMQFPNQKLMGSYHKSPITYEKLMAQDDRVEPSTLFTKTTPQTKARRKNRRAFLYFLVAAEGLEPPTHGL